MQSFRRAPLTDLADFINGYAFAPEDISDRGLPIIRIEQLKDRNAPVDLFNGEVPTHNYVDNSDLIFSWSASLFLQIWDRGKAVLNQHLFKVIPRPEIDKRFLKYCIEFSLPELTKSAHGSTMQHITRRELDNFHVSLPTTKAAQSKVAEVLATVDKAIEQTEALIAKYQRMKAGLMHDLLTRGIDEHGRLRDSATHKFKDSPLGIIPEEWEVGALGSWSEINSGVTLGRRISGPDTIELPYLRVANVQDGYVDLSEIKTIRIYREEVPRYALQAGDVLMNEGGDFDKLGRGTVWRGQIAPCLHQNHVFRVRPNQDKLQPDFLALVSASPYGKRFFVLSSKQSTNLASINSTQLKAFPIPRPDILEQVRIVAAHRGLDYHLRTQEEALAKLARLKAGLMQDLLTGKVSVESLL